MSKAYRDIEVAIRKDEVTLPMADRSRYTNKSMVIHSGPCVLKSVHVAGDAAGCEIDIFDGENSAGEHKAHIQAGTGTSYTWRPGDGSDFDVGIYIWVNATTSKCTVTYKPKSRKSAD